MGKKVYAVGGRKVKLVNGKNKLCKQDGNSIHSTSHTKVFRKKRLIYAGSGVKELFNITDRSTDRCFKCRKRKSECACNIEE